VEYDGETESLVRINGATGQRSVLYSLVYDEVNGYPYIGPVTTRPPRTSPRPW
jgi:hypothetical protein